MDVSLLAAEFESGMIPPERLPDLAVEALAAGEDSRSLRIAAGLDGADPDEQRAAFRLAMLELGYLPASPEDIAHRIIRLYAQMIRDGEVAPLEGARRLWLLEIDYRIAAPIAVAAFGHMDHDDLPVGSRELAAAEQEIRQWAITFDTDSP